MKLFTSQLPFPPPRNFRALCRGIRNCGSQFQLSRGERLTWASVWFCLHWLSSQLFACPAARVAPLGNQLPRLDHPRPDAPTGRSCARLFPVLALLLAAMSPFAAAPAVAAVLVSNIGQTAGADNNWGMQIPRAQGFTTGSNSQGYTLESIEVKVHVASTLTAQQIALVNAELWSATQAGVPNEKLADLTVPSSIASGNVTFTAPANTTLTASTMLFFTLSWKDQAVLFQIILH